MKIVLLAETFPGNTSYFGVMLPKYLARLGAEVHLLALDLPPYWNVAGMRAHYEQLVGKEWLVAGSVHAKDGYSVHIMGHRSMAGYMGMRGLGAKLREIDPDIVYSLSAIGWLPLQAALLKTIRPYKLFTGSHTAASTFPLYKSRGGPLRWPLVKSVFTRWIPGRFVSLLSERCHAPTVDCAEIAWRFFGVQRRKVEVLHLGVDTDVFHPLKVADAAADRAATRAGLGIGDDDFVVIYTGKITEEKRVDLVPAAVRRLRDQGYKARALVIGSGPAVGDVAAAGEVVMLPYQPYHQLARYYRASDVAVWPTNESTSMLDAAACGVPIVVSDGIIYREHVDGNGLVYRMGDLDSLVAALRELVPMQRRRELGEEGARKMAASFSWSSHASRRLEQYRAAVRVV
jgi:glycosyltransferase involved in cell wall biosynthesis